MNSLLKPIFKGDSVCEEEETMLKWILRHFLTNVAGGRWNILAKKDKEQKRRSFTYNVSPSDIGFSLYLLEYYSKSAILYRDKNIKEKKNHWSKETLTESLDFYTKKLVEAQKTYGKMSPEEKRQLDERVLELLNENDDEDEEFKRKPENDESTKKSEVYAGCSFFDEV